MSLARRTFLHLAAGVAALPALPRISLAQTYPSRTITIIVPFGAGGPTDVIARLFAERMGAALGQTIIVENVAGAAGTIGVGRAVRASADGYTLSIGHWGTHVVNGAVYSLSYDLLKDFDPVALLPSNPYFIVSKTAIPASSLKGLIEWLKANPDMATVATAGTGSAPHVIGVDLQNVISTGFRFIPYSGGDPAAIQDIIAGRVDMTFLQAAVALQYVQAGTIKAYAVTAKSRLAVAPSIPTVDEAGLPGFYASA